MIAETWPLFPWSGFAVAIGCGVAAGYAAMVLMQTVMRVWGHDGYVMEAEDMRKARKYMERRGL